MNKNNKYIIHLISKIRDSAYRYLASELRKNNLKAISPSHGDIIGILCLEDQVQMKDLATYLNRDKSTITALVNKLIDLGYVIKQNDPDDNRINLISLSDKGKKVKPVIINISENLRAKAYKGLSTEEKEILLMLLTKINNNFPE